MATECNRHGPKRNKHMLKMLQRNDGKITNNPDEVVDLITKFYTRRMQSPQPSEHPQAAHTKTQQLSKRGKLSTNPHTSTEQRHSVASTPTSRYPFESRDAVDSFHLEPAATPSNTSDLDDIITDADTFESCICTLSNNKTPGPDGVANEILKALPSPGKQALHNMIKLMWHTGRTPATWKHSNTVLLYKNKGSITDLQQYRRIGLGKHNVQVVDTHAHHSAGRLWRKSTKSTASHKEGFVPRG